jgi:protein-disulfide isomerase
VRKLEEPEREHERSDSGRADAGADRPLPDETFQRSQDTVVAMSELTSAAVPPVGPDDHVTGNGVEAIVYADFGCPYCAAGWARLRELPLLLCFRHFPMASKHPRAPALHAAAEASGRQGAFWKMCDSLYADRGHVDDPHLWERAEQFGLDLDRFRSDSRSDAVRERIERDFVSGIRAGVAGTPIGFVDGRRLEGELIEALRNITGR